MTFAAWPSHGARLASDMSLAELLSLKFYTNSPEFQQRSAALMVVLAKQMAADKKFDFEKAARATASELQIPIDMARASLRNGLEIYTAAVPASGGVQ